MGVAVCSGGTVKWSGAGDGSRWSDLANWVDGGTVDFAKAHVYDLSAAEDGANLVNDKVSSIGGFVLGAGQGTVTLSSTVAASALHGTWTIPASTTFVLKQVYRGMWSDYGTTTVSGGGTLRLDAADFQSANRAWNIEGGTVVELARGYPDLLLAQFVLRGGSVLRPLANGTKLGTLVVDATSCVALGDRTLTVCGGESGGYTMAGAVTGMGTIAFSGGKDISATASFPDFTGTLELGNASLAFGDGCSLGRDAAFVAKDNGILALGGDQVFGSISGLGTSGGLSIPAGAVATVSGAKAASNGTMLFRAAIRGEGGLTLDAPGRTLVLNGVNGYRGPTHVAAGTLTLRNDRRTCFPDGLVARYSFDGAFLGDSSPSGNDLTVPYAWTTVPVQAEDGVSGTKCARFSRLTASGGYAYPCLRSSRDLPLSGRVPFTVSLWIRPTQAASDAGGIVVGAPKQSDARFCMAMVEGRSEIMNVSGFGYVGLGGSQTGTWCHLALVQAADGSRKFYVNKALKATKAAGTTSDLVSQPLVLGDFVEGSWGASFDGDMDEVLVFDRELSADEIEGLYDNPLQATADVRVPEPVVHWAFDEAATPGRDAKAVLDLEARGPVDIASTDHTWGSAYRSLSDAAGFLSYAGAFPAAFPVGRHSFSVSIRMAVGGGTEGVAPFAFGDLSRANAFFRIGVNAHPSRVGVTVTQAGVANKFDTYASGPDHAHALEEASSLSHYVFTYDADHRLLVGYRDGVKTVSKTDVDVELPASGSVFVGYRPDALDTRRFQGLVDDVQVFDGALSEEEVLLLTRKLHFGDGVRAGRATAPDSPVCVEEGATLQFEGPGHTVGSLSGAGRVELANGASVVLSAVDAFTGTFSGEGALALADGCVLSVDAKRPDLPVADISRVTALPSHAVVRIADDKEGLLKTLARARVFTVLRANGFEDVEALSTWTVPFAAPGSYRFEVEDGCVLLKFRLGFYIIVK